MEFPPEFCRHSSLAAVALNVDFLRVRLKRLIIGVGVKGESGIGLRIFVRAIEHGFVGQLANAIEALPELLRFAFEHPAAAEREDAIADECDAISR